MKGTRDIDALKKLKKKSFIGWINLKLTSYTTLTGGKTIESLYIACIKHFIVIKILESKIHCF